MTFSPCCFLFFCWEKKINDKSKANKNKDQQAWHDEFVGSVVVRQEGGVGLGGGVLVIIFGAAIQGWITYQLVTQAIAQFS